jgi:hypothetical protein
VNIEVIMKISTFILEVEHKDDEDPVDVIFRFFVSIHYEDLINFIDTKDVI